MNAYKTADEQTKKLAYGLFTTLSWGRWDAWAAADAMTWINRLREAQPQTAEDFAAAIVNFDWMRPLAREKYRKGDARIDRAFALWAEAAQ